MSTSNQLKHWMRFDPTFLGVFPIDLIPHLWNKDGSFIINTQTSNLGGMHWICIRMIQNHAWIFDPLATNPTPYALCKHLIEKCNIKKLYVCTIPYQNPLSVSCGHHCVYFLYFGIGNHNENTIQMFINKVS